MGRSAWRRALDALGPLAMIAVPISLAVWFFVSDARSRLVPTAEAWAEGLSVAAAIVGPLLIWWLASVVVVTALPLRSIGAQAVAAGAVCAAMIAPSFFSSLAYAAEQDAWRSAPVGLGIVVGAVGPITMGVLWGVGVGAVRYPSMVRAVRAELAAEERVASGEQPTARD